MNPQNSSILAEGVVGDVVAALDKGRTMALVVERKIITMRATLAAGT
jgi:hypothetical protein